MTTFAMPTMMSWTAFADPTFASTVALPPTFADDDVDAGFGFPNPNFAATSCAAADNDLLDDLAFDEDTAKDIDDFTSLLATVEDDETAKDIDEFSAFMATLAKKTAKDDDMYEISLTELLSEPAFAEPIDIEALLKHNAAVEIDVTAVEDSEEDDDEEESEDDVIPPLTPWTSAFLAPIDPRCCIQTPVFKTIDSRIPSVGLPKMDMSFGIKPRPLGGVVPKPVVTPTVPTVTAVSPTRSLVGSEPTEVVAPVQYIHVPETCWVCKSGKSDERKRLLHRFVEKRHQRNWKRGARYSARSRVASSRVREGGRFVTKCEWVAASQLD